MEKEILKNLALNPAKATAAGDACCDVDHTEHATFSEKTDAWDKLGIFLSGLCAIHCLLTPILLIALPVFGEMFESEWVHGLMAVFILPIGLYAFWSGYKHHRQTKVFALGVAGLLFIVSELVLPHEIIHDVGHHVFTVIGSTLLITAHYLNRRACLCHRHVPSVKSVNA